MSHQHPDDKNKEVSSLSWWQKEGVFMGSGLWPGYWLCACKDWFQSQYNNILWQDPQQGLPWVSNQWKNSLKFEKQVKQLHITNSAAAEKYLVQSGLLE
jgi:hypothetical protein